MDQLNNVEFDELLKNLDADFVRILSEEIDELAKLNKFTESIQARLEQHYAGFFPKICRSCQTKYLTREEYLQATANLGNVFTEAHGLQEYRNCPCGSTLLLLTEDRRDGTRLGIMRRELYERCFVKLAILSPHKEDSLIHEHLRRLFQFFSS